MNYEKYVDYALGLEFYISENIENKQYLIDNFIFPTKDMSFVGLIEESVLRAMPTFYKRKIKVE